VRAYPWLDPDVSAASTVVVGLTFAATVWAAGRAAGIYPRLVAARDRGAHGVVRRYYRRTWVIQAARCAVVLAVVAADPGVTRRDVGLRRPQGPHVEAAVGWTGYGCVVVAIAAILLRFRARRGRPVPGQRMFAALVARDGERRAAAGVALGAGVSEELLFRGLFVAVAVDRLELEPVTAVLLVSAVFGLMHVYQGWPGVIGTAVAGFLFGWLYLMGESLLLPIVVHVVVDLRALVLVPLALGSGPRH
jgi:uncharacterized protein